MNYAKKLAIVMICSATFCANGAVTEYISDTVTNAAVVSNIVAESTIPSDQIHVEVNQNVVKLTGVVDTHLQAEKAIELAMAVNGVVDVDSTDLKLSTEKSLIESGVISAKVRGKIALMDLNSQISSDHNIKVETKNKIVHIKGRVASDHDKQEILKAIKTISGVKGIKEDISVK